MKTILSVLGGALLAFRLHADPYVNWVSDSYSSFDVILSGTGFGWSGDVLSPSGLWQLSTANTILYPAPNGNPDNPPDGRLDNFGQAIFLGSLPSQFPAPDSNLFNNVSVTTQPCGSYFNPATLGVNSGPMHYGYLGDLFMYGYQGWNGNASFTITAIGNVNDPSTWDWTAEYQASGESLGTLPIPEPASAVLVALAGCIGWGWSSWRRAKVRMKPCPVRVPAQQKKERPVTTPASNEN